ncbi:hypothetical protein ACQ0MK_04195 [Thalassospira lucentensis]|uniref:hypothetical protein n=1 Tax=Thalassospira lucentensis TaxID=168935 RepID=UPI003D2ED0ED
MSIHKTAKCLAMIALTGALSACAVQQEAPVTATNSGSTIVTPWGGPSNGTAAKSASTTGASTTQNDNLVMMEDPNQKALDQMQQKQIGEARIALGILDRMAQRCVQSGDEAACNTLQTNWSTLSQQLHKTLSMVAGDAMMTPMSSPSNTSPMPANGMNDPMKPDMAPSISSPETPEIEKVIPMTQPSSDG